MERALVEIPEPSRLFLTKRLLARPSEAQFVNNDRLAATVLDCRYDKRSSEQSPQRGNQRGSSNYLASETRILRIQVGNSNWSR